MCRNLMMFARFLLASHRKGEYRRFSSMDSDLEAFSHNPADGSLVEFLHFDIQSTGQKSHCVRRGVCARLDETDWVKGRARVCTERRPLPLVIRGPVSGC